MFQKTDDINLRIAILLILIIVWFFVIIFAGTMGYLITLGVYWFYYIGWMMFGLPLPDVNRFKFRQHRE